MAFRTASDGFWVALLVPLAVYLQDEYGKYSQLLMLISFNSFLVCLFKLLNLDLVGSLVNLQKVNLLLPLPFFLYPSGRGDIVAIGFLIVDLLYLILSYVAINVTFPAILLNIIRTVPKSFTFGEATLVCQAFTISFWAATTSLAKLEAEDFLTSDSSIAVLIVHVGFLVCCILCRYLLFLTRPGSFTFLDLVVPFWAGGALVSFCLRCSISEFNGIFQWTVSLLTEKSRVKLISGWLTLTAASVGYVVWKNAGGSRVTTSDRKYFHFVILLVFVPGIILDYTLIFVASVAAVCAFILLETIRLLRVTICNIPLGNVIDNFVSIFRDRQDEGITILTPIYLLAGCSAPIWLDVILWNVDAISDSKIAGSLAGVLSIAVGDTFASIGGSAFGKTKWKGVNKSVEGTLSSIAAQVLFSLAITTYGLSAYSWMRLSIFCTASVVNALVEAKTDQIDNLVLPLLTYTVVVGLQRASELHTLRYQDFFSVFNL